MISAYPSVFDDLQAPAPSMASIEPLVDETVVVDGACEWVAPHLEPGRDPGRYAAQPRPGGTVRLSLKIEERRSPPGA